MLTDPDNLRVAVLCSRRAPGIGQLLAGEVAGGYLIAGCVCSDEDFLERPLIEEAGVPWLSRPLREFHHAWSAPLSDRATRAAYDYGTAEALAGFRVDAVFLMGWLYVVTRPLLEAYPGRVFNVHHSDLTVADPRRRYPGLRAIRDAIGAGETSTRATLHLVDDEIDHGPAVLRSWPFPVADSRDVNAHQTLVLDRAFGPLFYCAANLLAQKRLRLGAAGAEVDGLAGPFDLSAEGRVCLPARRMESAGVAA